MIDSSLHSQKLNWENFTLHPARTTNSAVGKVLMVALSVLFGCLTLGIFHLISYCKSRKTTHELPGDPSKATNAAQGAITGKTPHTKHTKAEITAIATLLINNLFETLTTETVTTEGPQPFSFSIYHPEKATFTQTLRGKETAPLFVKFKEGKKEGNLPLTTIIEAIQWHHLDAKWQGLTEARWEVFSKNALSAPYSRGFGDYAAQQVNITGIHPFVTAYSAHEYTAMNQILRVGKINLAEVLKTKKATKELGPESAELIDRVAKERLFACLCLTGSLKMLPPLPQGTIVSRSIFSDKFPHLAKYKKGHIVTEESFLSTTLPEGDREPGDNLHPGDIRYAIHLSRHSKGKSIQPFTGYPTETECLFPPSSSFKVVKDVERDADNRTIIVLEEVEKEAVSH